MAYFPKVNIPNTFYINAGAPSGGTKGNPAAPYSSPWDIVDDLTNASEILRLTPGTYVFEGPYNANNSHVPNAENTTYSMWGAEVIAVSVNTGTGALFSDRTGATTDEPRILRLNGGNLETDIDGATECYAFEFLNANSVLKLNTELLATDGSSPLGIAIGGSLYGKIEEFTSTGGHALRFLPGSNGTGPQANTTGRVVDFKIGKLLTFGTVDAQAIGWQNDGAEYTETDMLMNLRVDEFEAGALSTCFAGLFDGLVNSRINFSIGTLKTTAVANIIFNFGSWWASNMAMTDSNVLFELESVSDFSGRVTDMSGLILDNSSIHVKLGRVHTIGNPSGFAHIDCGGSVSLTNNSTLIISADEFVDTGSTGSSVIELRPFVTTDATSKVVITGTFRTSQAIPLVVIGETTLNIELKDVVFENDGTVAAIQRDGTETPTVNVAGVFDTNTIIAGAGITINQYDEYV